MSLVCTSYFSEINIQTDARAHSKHVPVIRCDIKPGSVERCIDLNRGYTSVVRKLCDSRQPIKIDEIYSRIPEEMIDNMKRFGCMVDSSIFPNSAPSRQY
jgi:hypothetical protein